MEDFTKFKLKSADELKSLLAGKDDFFVVACNKCFKEFSADPEPESVDFIDFSLSLGRNVIGFLDVDFLCNDYRAKQLLETSIPAETGLIPVISCGLGVQTVSSLTELPVFAVSDSVNFSGRHGMSLSNHLCDACGECYLNTTGGICPVTDCSKGLINGQCGGAKEGFCEVDKEKNCAWVKIHERLCLQDRIFSFPGLSVQLRDFSKIKHSFIKNYVHNIRANRYEGFFGGLCLKDCKEFSASFSVQKLPLPKSVVIPLSQHTGLPAEPVVQIGDHVKVGQKIGGAVGAISSAIHSSVSGIVKAIIPYGHPNSNRDVLSIAVESDGKEELHKSVLPCGFWTELDIDEIDAIIGEKGVVGMGGAGFPTPVKLKAPKQIDTVLLNGSECEPLLTSDHRVMLEYTDDVLFGLNILLKATEAQKGIIVIEDNKKDAINKIETKITDIPNIEVIAVKTKYPQGAEKMLIARALGRSIPDGALPYEAGVVVINVSTAKAISDAFQYGTPLIERIVTVSGDKINKPGNYLVKIGTSVKEIIDYCGGFKDNDVTVKLGGPMMGTEITDLNVPVIKGTTGIIAVTPDVSQPSECIRCGRCVDVCPMELLPLYFPAYADTVDWKSMEEKSLTYCIECGCCDYICPSRIPIRRAIREGKAAITGGSE